MKKLIVLLLISSSAWAQQVASEKHNFRDFNLIVKVEDQEKYYNEMLQESPLDPAKPNLYNEYRAQLAIGFIAKGNEERYKFYMNTNPKFSPIDILDLTYALEYLVDEGKNLNVVEKASRDVLEKLEKGVLTDGLSRTQVLWEVNALANARLGNIDLAMKNIIKSGTIKGSAREDKYFKDSKSKYLTRYSLILSAAGEDKRALDTLTKAIRNADSNPKLVATFREIYKKVYGSDKGADKYIASLQEEAYQKYYREVEKSFIADIKAPVSGAVKIGDNMVTVFNGKQLAKNVSLPNLNGKMVNFADYQGKILVIDFWTTGCTPCVAAFAGFAKVVAEYKKEPFQLFVINLFEQQNTVKSFIAKKGITLDVLHDEPNKAFDVQATPTKIIFDPMGNIRFYSIGYAGSTDREYYKLKAMVEIVKARASGEVTAQSK